ncbi:MAG: potassium channel family protein [Egibacteraceae bacterium]
MHVIIGGCGRVGAELADRLSEGEHDVVILDRDPSSFDRISGSFNGETLTGDITDKDILQRAGIEKADALAAVTNLDNANLMAVQIARELFGVPHSVARLFNPERESSYRKMGVAYVSGTLLVTKAIVNELRTGTFPQHVAFPDADVEVVEMVVTEEGHGVTLHDLERKGDIRVAAVRRGERVRIPREDQALEKGDLLVAALHAGAHRHLEGLVANPLGPDEAR